MKRDVRPEIDSEGIPLKADIVALMKQARKEVERARKRNKPRARFAVIAEREYRVTKNGENAWFRLTIGKPRRDRASGHVCPLQYETSKGEYSCVWIHGGDSVEALENALDIAKVHYTRIHKIKGVSVEVDGFALKGADLKTLDRLWKNEEQRKP